MVIGTDFTVLSKAGKILLIISLHIIDWKGHYTSTKAVFSILAQFMEPDEGL